MCINLVFLYKLPAYQSVGIIICRSEILHTITIPTMKPFLYFVFLSKLHVHVHEIVLNESCSTLLLIGQS